MTRRYISHATGKTFERRVLQNPLPVLVDFWAPWCAPCRALAPTLVQLAQQYAGKLTIVKVNVDRCQDIAETYAVLSIPTCLVFQRGRPVTRVTGCNPEKIRDVLGKLDVT